MLPRLAERAGVYAKTKDGRMMCGYGSPVFFLPGSGNHCNSRPTHLALKCHSGIALYGVAVCEKHSARVSDDDSATTIARGDHMFLDMFGWKVQEFSDDKLGKRPIEWWGSAPPSGVV